MLTKVVKIEKFLSSSGHIMERVEMENGVVRWVDYQNRNRAISAREANLLNIHYRDYKANENVVETI